MKLFAKKIGLLIAMLLTFIHVSAYDFNADGIYYTILQDGISVEVSNKSGNAFAKSVYTGDMIIPETVEHGGLLYNVTGIGQYAFYKSGVTSVCLPASIESIEKYAFAKCEEMLSCNFPEKMTYLGEAAFSGCVKLVEVSIPKGIHTLQLETFFRCKSIERLVIPNTVMRIYYSSTTSASSESGGLTTSQGSPCFAECTNLKEVIIEDGDRPLSFVDKWNGSASTYALYANEIFHGCPLESIYLGRTLPDTPGKSLFQDFKLLKHVKIGSDVLRLQNYAFRNCISLSQINIPNSISEIGTMAFSGCNGLVSAYLGDGIQSVPSGLFNACSSLEQIFIGNNLRTIANEVFNECVKLRHIVICSNNLESFPIHANNVPNNVKVFVPSNTSIKLDLPSGWTLANIAEVSDGEFEYDASVPAVNVSTQIPAVKITSTFNDTKFNVGVYNNPLLLTIEVPSEWNSTFETLAHFTIIPASLTVIANDATKVYGSNNPELTCSYFGFKNGETEEVLTKLPILGTTATSTSNVGTYPIIPYGAEAQNYTFNYERGTLTINKANQSIEWNQNFASVNVGDVIELTAMSTSGLPVTYSSTDKSIAEVYIQSGKNIVKFKKAGVVSLCAIQEGDENHKEAATIEKSIEVIQLATGIQLDINSTSLEIGEKIQLVATILPFDATNKTIIWKSDDESVAAVSVDGIVTGVSAGIVNIRASATDGSGVYSECKVSVTNVLVTSITLSETTKEMTAGEEFQLTTTIFPDNATYKNVDWKSTNDAIATVDNQGIVKALKQGECDIYVKAKDGSETTASCKIRVDLNSGLEDIAIDGQDRVEIYSVQGVQLFKGLYNELSYLRNGIYIVKTERGRTIKLVINN